MGEGGVAYDFESSLEQSFVWLANNPPASLGGYADVASAKGIAGNSAWDLVELASVVPRPM